MIGDARRLYVVHDPRQAAGLEFSTTVMLTSFLAFTLAAMIVGAVYGAHWLIESWLKTMEHKDRKPAPSATPAEVAVFQRHASAMRN